jgi:hypothetical protein
MKALFTAAILTVAVLTPVHAVDEKPDAQPSTTPFTPGLGEIMTLTQMRHLKLWFAGEAKNWDLAGYELDELKEGFDDASKYFPTRDYVPIADLIGSTVTPALPNLKRAIDAHDGAKFAAAFDKLTAACNACHQAAKHAFIVIQRPATSPYANQSFAPPKKQ